MAEALMDTKYVTRAIDDWEHRVTALMDNIRAWVAARPEWAIEEGRVTQRNEQLMREHDIPPRTLPTLNLYNRNRRVSIVPSALWIVGANGRVNIITNSRLYILVDRGGENGNPSDWQYTTPDMKPSTRTFNNETLIEILDEN